jgi:hypothetical protein
MTLRFIALTFWLCAVISACGPGIRPFGVVGTGGVSGGTSNVSGNGGTAGAAGAGINAGAGAGGADGGFAGSAGAAGAGAAGAAGTSFGRENEYSVIGSVAIKNGLPLTSEFNQLTQGPCEENLMLTAHGLQSGINVTEAGNAAKWRCGTPAFYFGDEPGSAAPFEAGLHSYNFVPPDGFACDDFIVTPKHDSPIFERNGRSCTLTLALAKPNPVKLTFLVVDQRPDATYSLRGVVGRYNAIPDGPGPNRLTQGPCGKNFIESSAIAVTSGADVAHWRCDDPGFFFGVPGAERLPFAPGTRRVFFTPPPGFKCYWPASDNPEIHVKEEGDGCAISFALTQPKDMNLWIPVLQKDPDWDGEITISGAIGIYGNVEVDEGRATPAQCPGRNFISDPAMRVTTIFRDEEVPLVWKCPSATEQPGFESAAKAYFAPGPMEFLLRPPSGYRCSSSHLAHAYGISNATTYINALSDGTCRMMFEHKYRSDVMLWFFIEKI